MPDTTITLAVGDYLRFKDIGVVSVTRNKEVKGLITAVTEIPLDRPLLGRRLFRGGSTVLTIQPWRVFQYDGRWWIAPPARYSMDDAEVMQHIPRPAREKG